MEEVEIVGLRLIRLPLLVFAVLLASSGPAWADFDRCQAVHEAAFLGEPEELTALLRAGADADCRDEVSQTPLITAAIGGSIGCVGILLLRGVEVNSRDELGYTALTHARNKMALFDRPQGERYRLIYGGIARLIEWAGGKP